MAPGRKNNKYKPIILNVIIQSSSGIHRENCFQFNDTEPHLWQVTLVQVTAWFHHKVIAWANVDPDFVAIWHN